MMPSLLFVLLSAAQICADLGYDGGATQRVLHGEIVHSSPQETSDRDLSVGFVFLSQRSPQELAAEFRRGDDLASDSSVVSSHRIMQIGAARDFDGLHLQPNGDKEMQRYLSVQPGETLNLSEPEMAAFRALGAAATLPMVEEQVRKTLLARHDAYRRGGIAALLPYARAKGQERGLGEGLQVQRAPPVLQRYAQTLVALMRDYPRVRPAPGDDVFYWIVYDLDKRPTPTLRHRMTQTVDQAMVVADREFYVSQGHNEMQGLAAFIPVDAGTLVVYRADASTDRVSGAVSGLKHSIGRRVMAKHLQAIFERARRP